MPALSLAVMLQIAASCAPAVHPETWLSVVHAESKFNPLSIGDNTTRQSYSPASMSDAVALATRLVAAGHSLDLGAAQINTAAGHLQRRGLPLSAAFDPCTGFRVGGEVLTDCWKRATGTDEQARLLSAIGCYNAGHPSPGSAYVQRVQASAAQIVPALRIIGGASVPPVAGPQPPGWDVWEQADRRPGRPSTDPAPPPAERPQTAPVVMLQGLIAEKD